MRISDWSSDVCSSDLNLDYDAILSADQDTRAGLFTATAQRLGTTPQNVEKDFWVCWTLDALFNGLPEGPRLLFKGGTSLSKGFGLIRRFWEDIDVTVFRDDLGEAASVEDLQALSRKKRDAALDAIKAACEAYINGPLLEQLSSIVAATAERAGLPAHWLRIAPHDGDSQIGRATSELQSLMRIPYAVFCLKKKTKTPPKV